MKPSDNRAKVGLLSVGHHYYWNQYPRLKAMGEQMGHKLYDLISPYADLIPSELVDTPEKSRQAGERFQNEGVDIILAIIVPGWRVVGSAVAWFTVLAMNWGIPSLKTQSLFMISRLPFYSSWESIMND